MAQSVIELGKTYRDRPTGVTGVAVARTEHFGGNATVCLEWRADARGLASATFAEQRLEPCDVIAPGSYA